MVRTSRVLRRMAHVLILLAAASCSSPAESVPPVWPLRPDSLEANGWDRDCDLLHLSLDVAIDFEVRKVYGNATSWIRAIRADTTEITLHGVGIEVREIQDSKGRSLDFDLGEPTIRIQLAEPLAVGEEESLRVAYSAKPEKGMFFFETSKDAEGFAPQVWTQGQDEDNRYWFPAWDYPNDRATFDARVRVGHDMAVVSNGELVDVEIHGGGERTFHWRMKDDLPTYLIALACGRWETYEDMWRGVPIHYHVGPGTGEEKARRALGETPEMMEFFSELLDYPYPYAKYDQAVVTDFVWGGMENTSVTILNDYLIGEEAEVADLDGDPRLLVAHELAHHWFGDLVTCFGWSHLWLNEAWASYLELLFEREKTDDGNFRLWLQRYGEWYMARGDSARHPVALDWRTQGHGEQRSNHVYDKGPWVLHMLSREIGEEAFWRATRAYLKRHEHGLVTSYDFARVIFDTTGRNVEGFLEQWVFAGGHPVFEVAIEDPEDDEARSDSIALLVKQAQPFDTLVPLFDVAVDIDLYFEDGSKVSERVRIREEEQRLEFAAPSALVDVVFDAGSDVLCEMRMTKPIDMWVHQASLDDTPAAQWRALPALREKAEESNDAAVAIMRMVVESPQPLLRQRAARVCDFDDTRARTTLIRAATIDPEPRVRREAAHALLQHVAREQFEPGTDDYEVFLSRLHDEPSPEVRAKIRTLLDLEPEDEPAEAEPLEPAAR